MPITGGGSLTKSGNWHADFWRCKQTYTGGTIINGGILDLTGGGGGAGTIRGSVTVNTGGTLRLSTGDATGYNYGQYNNLNYIDLEGGMLNVNTTANQTLGSATIIMNGGAITGVTGGNLDFFGGSSSLTTYASSNTATISGIQVSPLRQGNTTFDVAQGTTPSGIDLDISSVLKGDSSTASSVLTKADTGTMRLSAVNTYQGGTEVAGGTLILTGRLIGGGAVTVDDGATLNVTAGVDPAIPSAANLILGSSGTGTVTLGFANPSSTTTAPISSSGGLAVNNPVTVNITGSIVFTGTYPLIQYAGESGAGAFTLGTLPAGVSATLVDDHSSVVSLNVTATPVQTEVWTGSPNGNWDINTTANWLIGSSVAKYQEANIVSFDDTASGTTTIALNTVVHPSLVTFNNTTKNYTLGGSGAIAGATSLTLNGGGTVALNNTNTYTGGTALNAGTLAVGADAFLGTGNLTFNGGTLDITGSTAFTSGKVGNLTGNGTIQVDNPAGASFSLPITGGGSLTKSGNGTLTFGVQQTYTGGTIINGGILDLTGGGGGAGTIRGSVTVNTGGTLRLSTGDATGYNYGLNNLNHIDLEGGTLNVNTTANQTLGSATIIMNGGAITGVTGGNLDFFGGSSSLTTYASSNTATISGVPLTPLRQGSTTFDVQAGTTPSGIDLDISSVLKGVAPGGAVLTKADAGTMRLSAVNLYTGATEVQGGTLILTGRLTGGGAVTVDDSATLTVGSGASPAIANASGLNLGGGGALTLGFINVNNSTVPIVSVTNLTVNSAVTVKISGNTAVGQFPLIKYGGAKTGAGTFTLGTLPAGVSATLVDNSGNNSVDLNVTAAPVSIITDLAGKTNYLYVGGTYSISVVVGGNSPTYLWKKNGSTPVGGNSSTLTIPNVTTGDSGSYSVTVTNVGGSVQSATNYLVVLTPAGYDAITMATGPTSYWPLNESSGPVATDYLHNYNGTYNSSGVTYGVAGPVGSTVVTLNGTAGNVVIPYSAALNPSGSFTAEGWFNPSSVTSSLLCAMAANHVASPRSGWLIYESSAGWEFRTYNQNTTAVAVDITGGTPTVGQWSHVAVVWDGSKGYIYVNGVLKNTSGPTNFVANGDAAFTIGSRSDNAFLWGGSVGDVAFYGRALTPQEIQTHALNSPQLSIGNVGTNVVISWIPSAGGTLVASPAVDGTYTNVPAAVSPWTNAPAGNQFYRVKF